MNLWAYIFYQKIFQLFLPQSEENCNRMQSVKVMQSNKTVVAGVIQKIHRISRGEVGANIDIRLKTSRLPL